MRFGLKRWAKIGVTNLKIIQASESNSLPIGAIALNFGMSGVHADVIHRCQIS